MSVSPVATYMTSGLEGEMAMAPTEAIGVPSVMGDQVVPAFVDLKRPPSTLPKMKVLGALETPAAAMVRPPRKGPISRHCRAEKYSLGTCAAVMQVKRAVTVARRLKARKRCTNIPTSRIQWELSK